MTIFERRYSAKIAAK